MTRGEVIKHLLEKISSATNQMNCTNPAEVYTEAIRYVNEQEWHTGTPTEEGWYLVALKLNKEISYDTMVFSNGKFDFTFSPVDLEEDIVAWQKIEPYKENV